MKKRCSTALAIAAFVGGSVALGSPARAGEVSLNYGGTIYAAGVPVTSYKERKFKTVVRQQYDYSCGSAAIATLLTYHLDRPTSETQVFKAMWEAGDQEQIKTRGFSLLDMKRYLESLGYRADGFRVALERFARVGIPGIVTINYRGYRHFVLIKGFGAGEVLVGDPALGVKVYKFDDFKKLVDTDIIFVVRSHQDVAREGFNQDVDWKAQPRAPLGTAVDRDGLSTFLLNLPPQTNF